MIFTQYILSYNFRLIFGLAILILISNKNIFPQSVEEIEIKYSRILKSYEYEQNKLDSLKNLLNKKAAVIDNEKKKEKPDKNKIVDLMANTVSLTNMIDDQQKKVFNVERKLEDIKRNLSSRYTFAIDSLKQLKNAKGSDTNIELQILKFTENKLAMTKKIQGLSFNPDMIISIDLHSIDNPDERKLYIDYFNKALEEVNNQLKIVNEKQTEVNQMIELQKKADKFVEETEFTEVIKITSKTAENHTLSNNLEASNNLEYDRQAKAFSNTLNQLRTVNYSDIKNKPKMSTEIANLTMTDYQKILKELKEKLQDFKSVLSNKLKSVE